MDLVEKRILEVIDEHRNEIIEAGRYIWHHAELGYKEFKTSEYFKNIIDPLCDNVQDHLAITGVKGYLKPKREDEVTVCLMGELDALPIPTHPDANPETGASHCCGHNAQMAGLIGAAIALADEEVKKQLEGNVVFFGVPAEEYVEIEFKNNLIKEGKLGYGGGKCELIRIGALDDIDVTVGHHTDPGSDVRLANSSNNGFVCKTVCFNGKSSHAAGGPEKGVDALNAATLALHAIDMQRESFRDQDAVRVHGCISSGGDAMNVIADKVTMEHSVRANNIDAFMDASEKFDRSVRAGAIATGCGAEIVTLPGYLPLIPLEKPEPMQQAIRDLQELYPQYKMIDVEECPPSTGSTDYGDLSCLMPLLQFKTGGYRGMLHNQNMLPIDEELAYVVTAKLFALTAWKLLKNNGEEAHKLMDMYTPRFTKEEYIAYMDSVSKTEIIPMNPVKSQI